MIQDIQGVEVLVLDGLRIKPHPTHLNLEEAIETSMRTQARQTYLTHLTDEYNHDEHQSYLSENYDNIQLAWDGLWIDI